MKSVSHSAENRMNPYFGEDVIPSGPLPENNGVLIFRELQARLESHHSVKIVLCNKLENLADCLPDEVNREMALYLSRNIHPVISRAHTFEEGQLFPIIRKHHPRDDEVQQTLERLHSEHCEDQSFAEEVSDALVAFVDGSHANPETLGYMLRGFFEGLRRHVAAEQYVVLPILRNLGK